MDGWMDYQCPAIHSSIISRRRMTV